MQQKEEAHLEVRQIPAMEKFEDRPMSPVLSFHTITIAIQRASPIWKC